MQTKTKLFIFAGILILIIIVQFIIPDIGQTQNIRMQPTGQGVSYDFDASPSFHSNNSPFFFHALREGIRFVNSADSEARWTSSFSLNRPIMVARGNFVAVGEESGGRDIFVFNENGLVFQRSFEHPITVFSINESGILAVVVQYPNGHRVQIFTEEYVTTPAYSRLIVGTEESLWYPTAVEVSPNGQYIAVAILDLNTRLNTIVEIGYINLSDGMRVTGNTFGVFSVDIFREQLVYSLRFMDDNRLIIATTSYIIGYLITPRSYSISTQRELWRIELQNRLTHLDFYGSRYFAFVTGDRHMNAPDAPGVGTVHVYNVDGNLQSTFALGRRATHFSLGHRTVLVGADRNFHAIDFNGRHLWEHNAIFDTSRRDVIFLGNTNTVLIGGQNRAEVHERRRVRVNDFDSVFN